MLRVVIWHPFSEIWAKVKNSEIKPSLWKLQKKRNKQTFCHRMIWIQCPSLSTIFTKCNIISIFICDCQVSSCDETLIFIDKMNSSYSSWFALDAKLYIPSAIKKIDLVLFSFGQIGPFWAVLIKFNSAILNYNFFHVFMD